MCFMSVELLREYLFCCVAGVIEDSVLTVANMSCVIPSVKGFSIKLFLGRILLHKKSTKTHSQLYTIYTQPISNIVSELK